MVRTDSKEDILLSMSAVSSTWLLVAGGLIAMPSKLCPAIAALTGKVSLLPGRSVPTSSILSFADSMKRTMQQLQLAQIHSNSSYNRPFGTYGFHCRASMPSRTLGRWLHYRLPDGASSHRTCGSGPFATTGRESFGSGASQSGGAGTCFLLAAAASGFCAMGPDADPS